ncbi:MAG TPA: TPM domain-containing protein [Bryobacteraceae bacterium]
MKKLSISLALLAVCAAAALAADFAALKPQGYVSDYAGVVDAASRAQLEQYCASFERSTRVQIALVTLPNLDGEPVEDVANSIFRRWGVGQKGKNDGILLLLAIAEHKSRLETGYGLEPDITDGMAGDILRAMRPYLRASRYGDAMVAAAADIGTRIAHARNVSIEAPAPQPRERRSGGSGIPFGVLVGGVILFFLLSGLMRGGRGGGGGMGGFLTGMLLGNMMGRGMGGYRGGGGFGGFDSSGGGGGFGGFGGGDSGGGGASSDW